MKTNIFSSLLKSGNKKNKIKPKKPDNIYYSPADSMSPLMQYIGLALRTLILYVGVLGITSFICGAAGLSHSSYWQAAVVTPGHIALFCIPVALAAAIASLGKIPAIVTPFAYVGIYMGITAIAFGNPIDFTIKSVLRIYNYALYTVSSIGYYSLGNFMVNDGYDYSTAQNAMYDPYRFAGTFILATVIGFILYFCIQKKTRILPIVILMTAVLAPILTYNIAYGTTGISFIIVFVCAALALKVYDYRYGGKAAKKALHREKREEKRKLKAEKKEKKRAERKALKEEANRVFDKAIDADMPLGRAKKARRAVYKAHKDSLKTAKKNAKISKKLKKAADKKEKKDKALRIKKLKKQLSKAKGKSNFQEIKALLEAENAQSIVAKDEKKNAKAKKRADKKQREKNLQRISMAGGFAGAGVALAAFIAVCLPMALIDAPFMTIKPLNDRVQTVRTYVTAYLRGSDVNLNDPYVYGIDALAPRTLSFDALELDDRLLFRVDAEGTSNVYMRSWIATDFDWETGTWLSADYDEVHKYREEFGTKFTPDSIKTDYYKYVYPSSSIIEEGNTYKNFSKYGFTVQQTDVWRVRGSSLLLFVPAHINADEGILAYGELSPAPYKYQNYFEGTYSSFYYRYGRGYSTISYITALNRTDTAESIDASLDYYKLCVDTILSNPNATEEEATSLVYSTEKTLMDEGIEFQGTSIVDRYYFSMTDKEKESFLESIEAESKYKSYVYENYTEKAENEAVTLVAEEIFASAKAKELEEGKDGVLTAHESAIAVSEYFRSDDFYYTETPNSDLTNGKKPVIEAFLTDVKQGYCSHFASSAVYILREAGIPCRYVEGYVAKDFESLGTNGSKNRADVYGTNAHAWIEIYVDGMGWMQYEVTPGELSEAMYDPNSATVDPMLENLEEDESYSPPPQFGDEPDIEELLENEDFTVEEEVSDLEYFVRIVIIALCIGAVLAVIWFIVRHISKKASMALEAKYAVIDSAKNIDHFFKKDTDNHKSARQLNDWILEIFELVGCEPAPGELPAEFVERMRADYVNLSTVDIGDVIDAMQKEEFGHGLNYNELSSLAKYLEDITVSVYASMNPIQKIVNRYFKRKI